MALAGCSPSPAVTADEASAVIADVRRGRGDVDLCTKGGRSRFREAVRIHSARMNARGEAWPDMSGLMSGENEPDMAELTVIGAVLFGWVKPGDLSGRAGQIGGLLDLSMALSPNMRKARRGVEIACPEVMEMQRLTATQRFEEKRFERQVDAVREDGDLERIRVLGARMERHTRHMMREMDRLAKAIETKVAAAR